MGDISDIIKYTIIKIIVEDKKNGRVDFIIDGRIFSISILPETPVEGIGKWSFIIR
jgi:hypothetical protein